MTTCLTSLVFALSGLLVCFESVPGQADEPASRAKLLHVQKIWDASPHQAFTDLIRFRDQWFCVFRQGEKHVSADGSIRILTSRDGTDWTTAQLITMPEIDLRDPKICLTPAGKLMLCGAGVTQPPLEKSHQSYVWFSDDGKTWSEPHPIGDKDFWIWRIVWHNGTAYGIGYRTNRDSSSKQIRLYKSTDGLHFEALVADLAVPHLPNEATLLFLKDDTALCVLRREDKQASSALLGTARPPYTEWTWKDLKVRVGGPDVLQLPDGRLVVGGRKYPGKTELWWLDPAKPELTEILELPSGGDTSYPGLVYSDDKLWVSYYSSHEGKTSIYLAQVQLPAK